MRSGEREQSEDKERNALFCVLSQVMAKKITCCSASPWKLSVKWEAERMLDSGGDALDYVDTSERARCRSYAWI